MDLAKVVSCTQPYEWTEGEWRLGQGFPVQRDQLFHVVALDFGVKRNILRKLAQRDCRVTVLPAWTSADEILHCVPTEYFFRTVLAIPSLAIMPLPPPENCSRKEYPFLASAWAINCWDWQSAEEPSR